MEWSFLSHRWGCVGGWEGYLVCEWGRRGGRGQTASERHRERVCGFFVPPFHSKFHFLFLLVWRTCQILAPACLCLHSTTNFTQSNLCMHELPQVMDRRLVHYDISSGLILVHILRSMRTLEKYYHTTTLLASSYYCIVHACVRVA